MCCRHGLSRVAVRNPTGTGVDGVAGNFFFPEGGAGPHPGKSVPGPLNSLAGELASKLKEKTLSGRRRSAGGIFPKPNGSCGHWDPTIRDRVVQMATGVGVGGRSF